MKGKEGHRKPIRQWESRAKGMLLCMYKVIVHSVREKNRTLAIGKGISVVSNMQGLCRKYPVRQYEK